jgi:large subunit ribosomal protein L18
MKLTIRKRTLPKTVNRMKKKIRVRKSITGTLERPRLSVFRSLANIYVQLIDDVSGTTLATASSLEKSLKDKSGREAAKAVGAEIAKRAQAKKISDVVFDRNGYLYHGRVKELADAAREAGLKF